MRKIYANESCKINESKQDKKRNDKSTIVAGNFVTYISMLHRITGHKRTKDTEDLNDIFRL